MEHIFEQILFQMDEMNEDDMYETRVELLIELKEAVEGPDSSLNITALWTRGYLPYLLNNLGSPQKYIVFASLEIFSNCTMEEEFTRETMVQHDLLSKLHDLVNLYPEDESVKEVIFRILGNICEHGEIWVNSIITQKPEFLRLALGLMRHYYTRTDPEATLVMALRFLRTLLLGPPTEDTILSVFIADDVMKVISLFFIDVILETELNENILQQTMELLHTYSKCDIHDSINDTFPGESILFLCSRMRLFLERIPRIMKHFIRTDQLRYPDLHTQMCDWIIHKVKDMNIEDSKDEYVGLITCLCFLLVERCEDRHTEYLPELVKVLKFIENPSYADIECFILIIMAINKSCSPDDRLILNLVDCDLFPALIEKLKWIIGKKTLTFDFDHERYQVGPRKISGRPHILGRCSHPNPRFVEKHSASSSKDNGSESGCPCSDGNLMDDMKYLLHEQIMSLFHKLVFCNSTLKQLAGEKLITALLNSAVHTRAKSGLYSLTITRIDHAVLMMNTTIIGKIFHMQDREYQHDTLCSKCIRIKRFGREILENLEKTALTDGMEKIREGLSRDKMEQKVALILNIPYIFRRESSLAQLLLQFDCLKSLAQLLKDGSSLKKRTIKVLYIIASRRLEIADPTQVDIAESTQETTQATIETAAAEKILVTFKLDDGSTMQADRRLLTKRSWYFRVLLDGEFRESKRRKVDLHDTPTDLLTFMLRLLEHPEEIKQLVMEHDLDFLFDAFVFIDRHGQSDLHSLLTRGIAKYRINSMTVVAIYRWSIELKLNQLKEDVVKFALVHNFEEDDERVLVFDSLLEMEDKEELLGDIQIILERSLRPFML